MQRRACVHARYSTGIEYQNAALMKANAAHRVLMVYQHGGFAAVLMRPHSSATWMRNSPFGRRPINLLQNFTFNAREAPAIRRCNRVVGGGAGATCRRAASQAGVPCLSANHPTQGLSG